MSGQYANLPQSKIYDLLSVNQEASGDNAKFDPLG